MRISARRAILGVLVLGIGWGLGPAGAQTYQPGPGGPPGSGPPYPAPDPNSGPDPGGYVDPLGVREPQPPSGPMQPPYNPNLVPLQLLYSPTRQDYFSAAREVDIRNAMTAPDARYQFIRVQGYVFAEPTPGTIPLELYWNDARQDNLSATTPESRREAEASGYAAVGRQGYIFTDPRPGTVPLELYYNNNSEDGFLVSNDQDRRVAESSGYTRVRLLGYIVETTR